MLVQKIQSILIEKVNNNLSYYIELKWTDNMGSIHIYTKKHKLLQRILNLSENYTNYYKKEYKIQKIIIKQIINKNPHIKINTNK